MNNASLRLSTRGWTTLQTPAPSASRIGTSPLMKLAGGAGKQARFLDASYMRLVLGEIDGAAELGWQSPPPAPIPVALAHMHDPDWALDEDERKF